MRKYDEVSVVRALSKNPDVRINNKTIEVVKNPQYVGNGSWGKIDFLTHYCGYKMAIIDRDAILAEKAAAQAARKEYEKEKKAAIEARAAEKMDKAAKGFKGSKSKKSAFEIPISVI